MGYDVVQFPRDPGALLQHGPPGPLQFGALGLGGQGPLGAPPGTDAVQGDRRGGEHDGGAHWAGQVRHFRSEPQQPRDEAQPPHPPQHRPPIANSGHTECHQQHDQLRRAPRPASPPLTGYQRGQQQREPPDPPGQQRIAGRQRQRRHHRPGQQQGWQVTERREGNARLAVHAAQVDHVQRQRHHGQR